MAKTGRNDPCPCGSGLKYKRCCLPKLEAEARASTPSSPAPNHQVGSGRLVRYLPDLEEDNLDELSNRVLDLINAGRLDEAEAACEELKREYPDVIDGMERTGMIHEARGETKNAIECYQECLLYIDQNPEFFEEASRDWYRRSIARLRDKAEHTTDALAPEHDP